jgi:xylan 1,4-beta-xylosidase
MIHNPILPGFNPDPSIVRCGDDYYIATSTFEWFPAISIYHSTNLKDWKLITHVIQDSKQLNLQRLPSAKGVWAPCLTYNDQDQLFYITFSVMYSHYGRYFDLDNVFLTAPSIFGPWDGPYYLHSVGFDPSFFHDMDGKHYVVSLEWELRNGPGRPGAIVLQEYNPTSKSLTGPLQTIWNGGTRRGCLEGPHLYKRGEWYYLLCAEGGTGYGHCVTVARARSVWGPYEGDPENPILSASLDFDESDNADYLKPHRYNPASPLQKPGHGSLVETPQGELYLAHLCARPILPELRCTLGRETALQRMYWTEDGWLRKKGGKIPDLFVAEPGECTDTGAPHTAISHTEVSGSNQSSLSDLAVFEREHFDRDWNINFMSPRYPPQEFADLQSRPGYLRLYGQQSLCSLDRVALIARRLTSLQAKVSCAMEFSPRDFRHSAGLVIYYDNLNYFFLRLTAETPGEDPHLMLTQLENGERKERTGPCIQSVHRIYLKLEVHSRDLTFYWTSDNQAERSTDSAQWHSIGETFDVSVLSDEYCTSGEFTGTMVGLACVDTLYRSNYADFDWFEYRAGL